MADVSGRRRVRHLFASRRQKPAPPSSNSQIEPDDLETDALEGDSSNAHVMSSSASEASSVMTTTVAMESPLKKRLAKLPVMHDRYCVATFETNAQERSCVTLRSYKSRRAYYAQPEKPSSAHELQRIRDWDGKTGFHRYAHAFTMETRDRKLFQCVAPSAGDKSKWLELLPRHAAFRRARDRRRNSMSTLGPVQRSEQARDDKDASGKARAASVDLAGPEALDGRGSFAVQDRLFRTTSDAVSDETTLEGSVRDRNEPLDWGLYGEGQQLAAVSKYDVQETDNDGNGGKSLGLLGNELLDDTEGERQTLDADAFLFGENGASRFGAVFVRGVKREEDNDDEHNDDAEFVDEEMEARAVQKDKENKMKRRAQKLETNRDLYAEMAAARLAGMRKEARHSKKRYSHRHSRLSTSTDASDVEILDEEQSLVVVGISGDVADPGETRERCSSLRSLGSFNSRERSFVGSENISSCGINGDVSGNGEEEEVENEAAVPYSVVTTTQIIGSKSAETGYTEVTIAEAEELRQIKKESRADRRAKKRMMMKEKEEEERMALEAFELARAHREEQRAREEAKAHEERTKRDKNERREMKEMRKHERVKKYQADLRKVADRKEAEGEVCERKAKKEKKKLKRKEKHILPAERIHRRGEKGANRFEESVPAAKQAPAEAMDALVAVKDESTKKMSLQLLAATSPVLTPVPVSTPSPVLTESFSMRQAVSTSTSLPAPSIPSTYENGTVGVPALAGEGTATAAGVMTMPPYHMSLPPFAPSYLHGPQSMPAYGLAATFGAYPPFYTAPYCYGRPVGLQPALMRPNMGFVAGLSAMNSFGTAAGPAPGPPTLDSSEPMIGPQLPTLEKFVAASSDDACAPFPLLSSAGNSVRSKLIDLPELPDVIEF